MTFTHLDDVLAEVKQLGQLFAQAGYRLFLVGGIVRDQWLDEPLDGSSDIDLTTNALPAEIKRIVVPFADDLWTQGEKFGTIGLRAGGRDYEITTHRAESYASDSRKPVVSFGDNIDVDLSRRDFTVNAMAIELPAGDLVDPCGGAVDLPAKRLRTPLSADISFTDDPLRMMRAARFATKFSLVPDDEVRTSATRLHERIRIVAIERIGVELRRLLGLDQARVGLGFLAETGLLAEVLSYSEPALRSQVAARLDRIIQVADALPSNWHQRLAGIGIAAFDTADGVQAMCRRLRLSRDDERTVSHVARAALAIRAAQDTEPETLRRWLATSPDVPTAVELATVIADDPVPVVAFDAAVEALGRSEDISSIEFISGETIMAVLGVSPGPIVGKAQRVLRDQYFVNGPVSSDGQIELLRRWNDNSY